MNTSHVNPSSAHLSPHLSPQIIASYFEDTLTDAALLEVETHVADCDQCALSSQQALAMGDVVDRWTARAHGQAAVRAILLQGLSLARLRSTVVAL